MRGGALRWWVCVATCVVLARPWPCAWAQLSIPLFATGEDGKTAEPKCLKKQCDACFEVRCAAVRVRHCVGVLIFTHRVCAE